MRPTSQNFVSAKFSKLFALSVISSFEDNHPSGNFKVKYPFEALCWNVNENCDVYVAIDRVTINLKTAEKNYFSGFLCSLYLTSLTSVYL